MNSERVLDAQGNFVTLKSTPKYDNPLEKEVKVLKEENSTLKNIVKSKNDELKECSPCKDKTFCLECTGGNLNDCTKCKDKIYNVAYKRKYRRRITKVVFGTPSTKK